MGIALIFGLIYMIILRICAGVIVFLTIIAYLAGLVVLGAYLYINGSTTSTSGNSLTYMTYIGYALWALAGLSFICFCCCRK